MDYFRISTEIENKDSLDDLLSLANDRFSKSFVYKTLVLIKKYNISLYKKYRIVVSNFEIRFEEKYGFLSFSLLFSFDNGFYHRRLGWRNDEILEKNRNNILFPNDYLKKRADLSNWWSFSVKILLHDGSFDKMDDYVGWSTNLSKKAKSDLSQIFLKLIKTYYNIVLNKRKHKLKLFA